MCITEEASHSDGVQLQPIQRIALRSATDLRAPTRLQRLKLRIRGTGICRREIRLCRQPAPRQHRHLPQSNTAETSSTLGEAATRGDYPRQFIIDPTGNFLYSCNQRSDNLTVYRINQITGVPKFVGQYVAAGTPSCIIFLP